MDVQRKKEKQEATISPWKFWRTTKSQTSDSPLVLPKSRGLAGLAFGCLLALGTAGSALFTRCYRHTLANFWVYLLVVAMLFFSYGNYWSAHWYSKWTAVMMCASLWWAWWASKKTSLFFFPLLATYLLVGTYVYAWPFHPYAKTMAITVYFALAKSASYSVIALILGISAIVGLPKGYKSGVRTALVAIFWLSVLRTFAEFQMTPFHRGAFSGNASMNGCLIAALMPFALTAVRRKPKLQLVVWLLSALSVYMTGASIPVGVLLVSTLTYFGRQIWKVLENKKKYVVFTLLLLVSLATCFSHVFTKIDFFNTNGRLHNWINIMDWWDKRANHWFGAGPGTGSNLFPAIQYIYPRNVTEYEAYLWLHSDWLQILFELGWVGLASAVLAYGYVCIKASRSRAVFASVAAFGAAMLPNYPLRLPIHATCFVLVIWLALNLRGKSSASVPRAQT